MEILRFLLSFFLQEYGGGRFSGVSDILKKYDYDIVRTVKSVTPNDLSPIVENFMKKENPSAEKAEEFRLEPIKDLADRDIIYALNGYLGG